MSLLTVGTVVNVNVRGLLLLHSNTAETEDTRVTSGQQCLLDLPQAWLVFPLRGPWGYKQRGQDQCRNHGPCGWGLEKKKGPGRSDQEQPGQMEGPDHPRGYISPTAFKGNHCRAKCRNGLQSAMTRQPVLMETAASCPLRELHSHTAQQMSRATRKPGLIYKTQLKKN